MLGPGATATFTQPTFSGVSLGNYKFIEVSEVGGGSIVVDHYITVVIPTPEPPYIEMIDIYPQPAMAKGIFSVAMWIGPIGGVPITDGLMRVTTTWPDARILNYYTRVSSQHQPTTLEIECPNKMGIFSVEVSLLECPDKCDILDQRNALFLVSAPHTLHIPLLLR
jgi:hypothetical protein